MLLYAFTQVYDGGACSKLCQCMSNATVVCRSLPCVDGLQCTHRNIVYGQSLLFTFKLVSK